jgi:hypothetical protein
MRLPTKSHRPVMLFLPGMSSLSSTGKTARVQTPHSPMKSGIVNHRFPPRRVD